MAGFTTQDVLTKLATIAREQYKNELERLPMKKDVRETLSDGFADGFRAAVMHLTRMNIIEIVGREEAAK